MRYEFLLIAGVLLTACAGPQAAPAAVGGDQPRYGGRLTLSYAPDMANYDPSIAIRSESTHFSPIAYESLLGYKSGPGMEYMDTALEPRLAERWEVSSDARTYTFHLRKEVKFGDLPPVNGRELNANDVKFSYEYYSRTGEFKNYQERKLPAGTFAFMLAGLEGIDTPDRYTAVVRFKDPYVPFLNYSASYRIPIAAQEIADQDGHLQNRIVTTGPFQLDTSASQQGSHWVWKKHGSYWQAGKPYLDEVKTLLILEENAEHAAFKSRQVDFIVTNDYRAAEEQQKATPDAIAKEYPLPNAVHQWMTMKPGDPLYNPKLRKALSLAINRDEFIRVFGGGRGGWGIAGVFPGFFTQEEIKQVLRYDPAEARRLVTEAGYPNGVELIFMTSRDYGEAFIAKAELLQSQLKKAGINLTFRLFSQNEVGLKRRTAEGYDLAPTNRAVDTDVDSWIYAAFHSTSQSNFGKVNDPKLDALVEAQRRTVDPARRREAVREAGRYIGENALGISLPFQHEFSFTQPYVRNFHPNFGAHRPLAGAWVVR